MRRVLAGLLLTLSGCNPTGGIADTADAALPNIKRYFDGPGSKIADGPWSRVVVDLDVDTLYHVGARRDDDKHPTFHLFGTDARDGCAVSPNAGTWLMGKPDAAPFRLLPYLESIDSRGRGRLRFTTLDCQVQDLALEDAGRPYPRLYDHGYLVPTKDGYTFADPWTGESRAITAQLTSVLLWSDAVLLWADDQLKSFSEQFEPGSQWGNQVVAAVAIRNDFLVEDADGIHHVQIDHDSLEITSEDVLEGACHLQQSSLTSTDGKGVWLVVEQPCGNPKPTLAHLDATTFETLDSIELPFEADARHARVLLGTGSDAEPAPPGAVYESDVADDGFGTLWAWRPGMDAPIELGEHGNLDSVGIAGSGSLLQQADVPWDGAAQINFQQLGDYQVHDLTHFRWDGTTEPFAEHIVYNTTSGEALVNFDGIAGELPEWTGDTYRVVGKGIPPYSAATTSYSGERQHARIDQYDGSVGRAVLGTDGTDPLTWQPVGTDVPPDVMRFSWFMPALIFLENWDADNKTGSLVAYNYELDARATIAEGVSSFDLTSYPWDGVVYSIPKGKKQGIWFSKAK